MDGRRGRNGLLVTLCAAKLVSACAYVDLFISYIRMISTLQTRTCTAPTPAHGGAACVGSDEIDEQCYGECTTAETHDCRYVVYPELFANEEPIALATGVSAQYTPGDMYMPSVLHFTFAEPFDVNTISIQAPGYLYFHVSLLVPSPGSPHFIVLGNDESGAPVQPSVDVPSDISTPVTTSVRLFVTF